MTMAFAWNGARVEGLDDLIDLMGSLLQRWDHTGDNRAAFLRTYRVMTIGVRERLARDFFLDPAWIERVAVRFGWWYFKALAQYEGGRRPPPAWAYAFTIAHKGEGFLLQDMLLGMNAHINNDLPQVVASFLREETPHPRVRVRRRFDHDQINRVLYLVIPAVEAELTAHYGRLIGALGYLMGGLDQSLATYGLINWRDTVWQNAQFLLAAQGEAERRQVVRVIEGDALRVAQEIDQFIPLAWLRPLAPVMRGWRLC
jgi:hypothetical protein